MSIDYSRISSCYCNCPDWRQCKNEKETLPGIAIHDYHCHYWHDWHRPTSNTAQTDLDSFSLTAVRTETTESESERVKTQHPSSIMMPCPCHGTLNDYEIPALGPMQTWQLLAMQPFHDTQYNTHTLPFIITWRLCRTLEWHRTVENFDGNFDFGAKISGTDSSPVLCARVMTFTSWRCATSIWPDTGALWE